MKHILASIDDVSIYPIISLVIFFTIFTTMLVIVFKMKKAKLDEVSNLPLED